MGDNNQFTPVLFASLMSIMLLGLAPAKASAGANEVSVQQLEATQKEQAQGLAEQSRLLKQQRRELAAQKEALEKELAAQKKELDKLRAQLDAIANPKKRVDRTDLGKMRATGEGPRVAQEKPAAPVGKAPTPPTKPPEVAQLSERVGVLTPRGKFVLEPSLQYSHSNDSRVQLVGFTIVPALTIGLIDIRNVNRDMFVAALTGRYGLTNRLEVEARIPWVYRADSSLARPLASPSVTDNVFNTSGRGLGDIEFAARYQLTEHPPFYIGWLRLKTRTGTGPFDVGTINPAPGVLIENKLPTGTGFYTLQPGITALIPSDPAVFFGGVSYLWNIKRHIDSIDPTTGQPVGEYDPGDGVNFNFGMGLGINDKTSFSIGYDHTTFFKDKQNGQVVPNAQTTQVGSLLFGVAYRIDPKTTINLSLGAGLTQAAPNVQLTLRVPMTF